jgi:anti-anti-sigma factor
MLFARLRLSTQLLILTVGTALLVIVLLVGMAVFQTSTVVRQEGDQRLSALTQATSDLVTPSLVAQDTDGIQRILTAVVREEGLDRAFVFSPDGAIVASQRSEQGDEEELSADDQDFAMEALRADQINTRDDSDNLVDIAVPIHANGQAVGVLLGQSSTSDALDELVGTTLPQMSAAGLGVALLAGLVALVTARYIAAPLRKLSLAAVAVGQGQLETLPKVRGSAEVSALADAFGQMVEDLRSTREVVAEQQRSLETRVRERTADLERTLAELRESSNVREQLSATVRGLASPVVPVLDGILVMPLIGVIDTQRAGLLTNTLLHAVQQHHAKMVILDVTGVPIIDTQVARTLLNAARSVKLLGTQTILVGLRPELAQTIVGLGLDLSGLITQADLQSGVSYAMRQRPHQ